MQRKKQGNIEWMEFELLAGIPEIVHGVFLRRGGVSEGAFTSLNAGYGTGDKPEHIASNRETIRRAVGIKHFVSGCQEHGTRIETVSKKHVDKELPQCDGMVTKQQDIGLAIKHADCQAAIFYDPVHHAIGNVHAGWRGTVKNIYRATVDKMKKAFKTNPKDLLVCISPSLGPAHAQFKNYKEEFPEHFWPFQAEPEHFNLWAIARMQLEECGVKSNHIEIAEICSYSHPEDLYSYRRDKVTGRNTTLVALKP